jgi:AAA family ATP:ADP antiporter
VALALVLTRSRGREVSRGPTDAVWVRLAGIAPDEAPRAAWSFALFFCVFAGWYILRPLRDAMGIVGKTSDLPRLFLVTLGVTLALTPVVSAVVSRLSRGRLLAVVYRFVVLTLLVFFVLLRTPAPGALAARAFFVWSSVFNLFLVALAWGFMADRFTRAQGIRLFALVGGGGTLGAMVGSLVTATLVTRIGAAGALLVAAALLEVAVRCVHRLEALTPRAGDGEGRPPATGGTLAWLRRAGTNPYFLAICAYLILFTFTSTVIYLEQARIVRDSLADTTSRAALFARMDLVVNASALVLQLFFVGRALRRLGVGVALAVLPVATLACFASIRIAPVLGVLVVAQVARRVLDYALTKPAREVLFTTVSADDKYRAKSFIDTFVYRSGDAIGAVGFESVWAPALAGVMVAVCAAWALLGLALGRRSMQREPPASLLGSGPPCPSDSRCRSSAR